MLACAVRLLDRGFFRVGGEDYAVENESYGLATMHKSHVRAGRRHESHLRLPGEERTPARAVDRGSSRLRHRRAAERRRGGGPELLAYREGGGWRDVKSADINAYVKEVTGGDFSAKDFRTWNATVLAAVALAVSGGVARGSKTARNRAKARAVKEVSHYLGNTPAVCRASYIDPRVFDRFDAGLTIGGALDEVGDPRPGGRRVTSTRCTARSRRPCST